MTTFLQLAFQGIALGIVFGLISLGFSIMFQASHTFNFAHGQFVALGAYVVLTFMTQVPYPLAFGIAVVVVIGLALLVETLLLRRIVGKSVMSVVLATLGLSMMVQQAIVMIWGTGVRGAAGPVGSGTVQVGGVALSTSSLAAIGSSLLVLVLLRFFFSRTRYGLAVRATASNREAALAQGIDTTRMFALSWAIAAFLAVVAAIFLASFPRFVSPDMGTIALVAIPAIVIGGMDSAVGCLIGGLIVGLIQVLGAKYLHNYGGGQLHQVLPYVLLLVILVVRPYGLFGSRSIERV
jgi:branched-chain amino acid transport system permease protein